MSAKPILAFATINARVMPIDRDRYDEPLMDAIDSSLCEVTGGGTMQLRNGEINYCVVDIDIYDVEKAPPLICKILTECGAPKGSFLAYSHNDKDIKLPFGENEGLAIYFNGTDLPAEVYASGDLNLVVAEFRKLLGKRGEIQGHWNGSTETAVYLYGPSIEEMKKLIEPLMSSHPLCQKARYEKLPEVIND